MTLLVAGLTLSSATLGLILFAVYRLASASPNLPEDLDQWLEDVTIDRYRPMLRLLDGDELRFVASMPGFTPAMISRLRQERCLIFRGYLRYLETDFRRVCRVIKLLMVQANHDRPDLARVLLRSQIAFAWGLTAVRVHVMFYRWGLGDVDVRALLKQFEKMRMELGGLTPAVSASAA